MYTTLDLVGKLPRHPKLRLTERLISSIDTIIIHTTDCETDLNSLTLSHISPNIISSEGCPSINYHDVITKEGNRYHTESYKHITWHAGKWNARSISIGLMYRSTNSNVTHSDLPPTKDQMLSLITWLASQCLCLKISPHRIQGHRELEFSGWFWKFSRDNKGGPSIRKTCPGSMLNLDNIRTEVSKRLQKRLKLDNYFQGDINGVWGLECEQALKAWTPQSILGTMNNRSNLKDPGNI